MVRRVRDLLAQLDGAEASARRGILSDIKTALASTESSRSAPLADLTLLAPLFSILQNGSPADCEVACFVLDKLLELMSTGLIVQQYHVELMQGISSSQPCVQTLCLTQLSRIAKNQPQVLLSSESLLSACIHTLTSEDTGLATKAVAVLKALGADLAGLKVLLQAPYLSDIAAVQQHNDTAAFRLYQLITELAVCSEAHLAILAEMLQSLLAKLRSQDVLVQLNALELLAQLTPVAHTRRWLEDSGATRVVCELLAKRQEQGAAFAQLLGAGLLRYCGHVARAAPSLVTSGQLSQLLQEALEDESAEYRLLGAETVACVAGTLEGKLALGEALVSASCRVLYAAMQSAPRPLKLKAFSAFAELLHAEPRTSQTANETFASKAFFTLCESPLAVIRNWLRAPDPELRCAVLHVLYAIAPMRWAQEAFLQLAGFTEFLLDRSTETSKVGKELKHSIISRILGNERAKETFGAEMYLRLKQFEKEGAFYVEAEASVGLEGAE